MLLINFDMKIYNLKIRRETYSVYQIGFGLGINIMLFCVFSLHALGVWPHLRTFFRNS